MKIQIALGKTIDLSPPQYKGLVALLAVDQYDLTREVRMSDRTDVTRPWCLLINSRVAEALVKVRLAHTYLRGERYESCASHTTVATEALAHTLALRADVDAAVAVMTKSEADAKAERESPEGKKLLAAALTYAEKRSGGE
jgi:hypothetical protein